MEINKGINMLNKDEIITIKDDFITILDRKSCITRTFKIKCITFKFSDMKDFFEQYGEMFNSKCVIYKLSDTNVLVIRDLYIGKTEDAVDRLLKSHYENCKDVKAFLKYSQKISEQRMKELNVDNDINNGLKVKPSRGLCTELYDHIYRNVDNISVSLFYFDSKENKSYDDPLNSNKKISTLELVEQYLIYKRRPIFNFEYLYKTEKVEYTEDQIKFIEDKFNETSKYFSCDVYPNISKMTLNEFIKYKINEENYAVIDSFGSMDNGDTCWMMMSEKVADIINKSNELSYPITLRNDKGDDRAYVYIKDLDTVDNILKKNNGRIIKTRKRFKRDVETDNYITDEGKEKMKSYLYIEDEYRSRTNKKV